MVPYRSIARVLAREQCRAGAGELRAGRQTGLMLTGEEVTVVGG